MWKGTRVMGETHLVLTHCPLCWVIAQIECQILEGVTLSI